MDGNAYFIDAQCFLGFHRYPDMETFCIIAHSLLFIIAFQPDVRYGAITKY